jgi:hypothetical protein
LNSTLSSLLNFGDFDVAVGHAQGCVKQQLKSLIQHKY